MTRGQRRVTIGIMSNLGALWAKIQLPLAILLAGGVLAWLLFGSYWHGSRPAISNEQPRPVSQVEVVGPGLIEIKSGTPLEKKLQAVVVANQSSTEPTLR